MNPAGPTIGLALIVKSSTEQPLWVDLGHHFDEVYIQINGKGEKLPTDHDNIHYSRHKWTDDFAAARNALLNKVETDYWVWMDSDDTIEGLDNLRQIVSEMEKNKTDVTFFPYQYAFNEQGECIEIQWRERILRTSPDLYWKGRVHETVLSKKPLVQVKDDRMTWVHQHKAHDEMMQSAYRNHKLLEVSWKEERDPRTAMYLGISHRNLGNMNDAIQYFREHIKTSGAPEHVYRSWINVAECYRHLEKYEEARHALDEAIGLNPLHPRAYFLKAQFALDQNNYAQALRFTLDGQARDVPDDISESQDPTQYSYRQLLIGAFAHLGLGNIKEAYKWYAKAAELAPDYPLIKDSKQLFESEYGFLTAIEKIQWLARYLKATYGKPTKLLESLNADLASDTRLNALRADLTPVRTWDDKSIVFFSGVAPEAWGPDTLDKGMGGSEEAWVYLTPELVKLGWDVTVYCDRDTEMEYQGVHWKPWTLLNPFDTFNIFVAWRNPQLANGIKAKKVLADIHDVLPAGVVSSTQDFVDRFMVKTNYHRSLFPETPDKKFAIVGNGIKKSQFTKNPVKLPHSVGYFSSYDRGLECLLDMWPEIRKRSPLATLDIYYGWNSFDSVVRGNTEKQAWKAKMLMKLNRLKDHGVTEYGRVSHEDLAVAMAGIKVWAYPTEFTEIHCITALKAQEAGCIPVTTGVAALAETVKAKTFTVDVPDIYTNKDAQVEFVEHVHMALLSGNKPSSVPGVDWSDVAKGWDGVTR